MQVKAVVGGVTTYYVGSHYKVDNGVVTKYYFAGAQRVAMRKNGNLSYLLADHLGSTSLTTNTSGALVSELRYKAWGETRYSSGTTPTSYRYTGQREEPGIGLYFYNARWYDPLIGRFTSADTIVPDGMQGLDRYAYVSNNPLRYTDPTGHEAWAGDTGGCNDVMKCIKEKQDAVIAEHEINERKCNNGNRNYCSTIDNAVKTVTSVASLFNFPTFEKDTSEISGPTVYDNLLDGDLSALDDLLVPTHVGFRIQ